MRAELAYDVARAVDLPSSELPEVALLGRSNVGKSSLINALLDRRQLARTSGTPGKTRRIHFYRIDETGYLVDLPGYGYAKVPQAERGAWRGLVEGYLRRERTSLRGALLLIDARREWREEERQLDAWLRSQDIALKIVLTKADKLSRQALAARIAALQRELALKDDAIAAVSAQRGSGLAAVASWIKEWVGVSLRRADGRPFT